MNRVMAFLRFHVPLFVGLFCLFAGWFVITHGNHIVLGTINVCFAMFDFFMYALNIVAWHEKL